jgi:hypothetical protein
LAILGDAQLGADEIADAANVSRASTVAEAGKLAAKLQLYPT